MLEFNDALKKIHDSLSGSNPLSSEQRSLTESNNRVLAKDIDAIINVPPADNSAMDGYAINTDDVTELPCALPVSQRIAAGTAPTPLLRGSAARIFTGAEIPENANCVVMQENCTATHADTVHIQSGVEANGNIRRCGQDIAANTTIKKRGEKLCAQDLGLIASIGINKVSVYKKLKVAIFSTGDELVDPGTPLAPGQIYDSNRIMIENLCQNLGCDIIKSARIADNLEETIRTFSKTTEEADLIVSCGGVSVGDEDHVKHAVQELGDIEFWKIRIKPGKPFAFGHINKKNSAQHQKCYFIGLPGNPVSAFVTHHLFGQAIINLLQGQQTFSLKEVSAPSNFEKKAGKRPEFIRVKLGQHGAEIHPNQSSGVLSSVCWADALAFIPENTPVIQGDMLRLYPI